MPLLRRLDVVAGAKGLARQGYQKRIYDSIILGRAGRSQQKRIYESIILGCAGRPPCIRNNHVRIVHSEDATQPLQLLF